MRVLGQAKSLDRFPDATLPIVSHWGLFEPFSDGVG